MRRIVTFLLPVVGVLVLAGCTGSHPKASGEDHLEVANLRFVAPFVLDHGALRVDPVPPTIRAVEPLARVRVAMKEADPQAFAVRTERPLAIGYGLVTIPTNVWSTHVYDATPAWVVVYADDRTYSHPGASVNQSPAPKPSPSPPRHAYRAFVLPDAETWAVLFTEGGSSGCGTRAPCSQVELARRHDSVPWHLAARHGRQVTVAYSLPSCAEVETAGTSESPDGATIFLDRAMPFGHPPHCSGLVPKTQMFVLAKATTRLGPPQQGPFRF